MVKSNPISLAQITKIHIAKQQLHITDQQYRDTLSGFKTPDGLPCSTCKQLNYDQAEILLDIFKKLGFKTKHNGKNKEFDELANRSSIFATPGQLRKIKALWMNNAREKTEEAMNKFISHRTSVNHITFVLKEDVNKLITAISKLNG
jgi:phage gp16-like protein